MSHAVLKNPGDRYKNFELKRVVPLPEIQCELKEAVHLPTGATFLHLANEDSENVFCLSFQTTPKDSTGVAHILEHTVLCGSEKYPIKDPFFAMTRRSLNTFMNAFTGSDFTCYPAASQVPKDFYNLLEVYLDSVFHPNLRELSFNQEGHRIEFEQPDDPSTPLQFKGIVYNEMKGAMASPDSRLSQALDEALYPDITYGVNSGGEPREIPNLTYEGLLDFHRTYYQPSRCLFFFYGNLPFEGHLDFVERHTLGKAVKLDPLPSIPAQKRFAEKITKTIKYPYTSDEDPREHSLIALGWLTCHILEQDKLLALTVLSIALLGTDASPLKMALLKSGLCKQVSSHLVDDFSEIPVVITIKGCDKDNASALEEVVRRTLSAIVKKGLPKELIENAIHQVEFHRSEITGDSLPYGLSLFMRCGLLKQHQGNPEDALFIHSLCDRLRKEMEENPSYYTDLIRTYFLDNPHAATVVAVPDREQGLKEIEEEKNRLQQILAGMDEGKKREVIAKAAQLLEYQREEEDQDLEVLPKVTLNDVPKQSNDYPLKEEQVGALKLFHHACFTNHIVYAKLVFPLPYIAEHELPLLKLFSLLMPQLGCGGRNYAENLDYILAHTGGVSANEALHIQAEDFSAFSPSFSIQGKALHRKADRFFPLLLDMVTSTDFTDRERLKEVLTKHFVVLESTLNQNAMRYAMTLAASGLNVASRISNAWNGLEYYHFVKGIVEEFDGKAAALIEKLQALQQRLLGLKDAHLVVTCAQDFLDTLKQKSFYGLAAMEERNFEQWNAAYTLKPVPRQGLVISSPVAFTSAAFASLPYTHADTPALCIAGNLFDNLTLHPRIREQGGAYGGGSSNNALAGNFCFYAYRDPNIASTFDAFEEAVEKVMKGDFKESDLEEAKLEIIQDLDSPVSPGSRGSLAYAWLREGKTMAVRQAFRDKVLSANKAEVIQAVANHIRSKLKEINTVVFANQYLLDKENTVLLAKGKAPLEINKV